MFTEAEKFEKFLIKKGFRKVRSSDREKVWYRAAVAPVSCFSKVNQELDPQKKTTKVKAL